MVLLKLSRKNVNINRRNFLVYAAGASAMGAGSVPSMAKNPVGKTALERLNKVSTHTIVIKIMSDFMVGWSAGKTDAIKQLVAVDHPSFYLQSSDYGLYRAEHALERFFSARHYINNGRAAPRVVHSLTTPLVQVDDNLQRARGMWWSPGYALDCHEYGGGDVWVWNQYAADFFCGANGWKLLSFSEYHLFHAKHNESWQTVRPCPALAMALPKKLKPDSPVDFHWIYSPTVKFPYFPSVGNSL